MSSTHCMQVQAKQAPPAVVESTAAGPAVTSLVKIQIPKGHITDNDPRNEDFSNAPPTASKN